MSKAKNVLVCKRYLASPDGRTTTIIRVRKHLTQGNGYCIICKRKVK